jgi:membrane protein required for colicin V production
MTVFDISFLAIVAALTLRGLWRGFMLEWASVAGLIAGYLVAMTYADVLAQWLVSETNLHPSTAKYTGFLIALLLTYVLVAALAKILTKLLKLILLGWINRLLGAISGAAKGLLLSGILLLAGQSLYEAGLIDWWDVDAVSSSPYLALPQQMAQWAWSFVSMASQTA